MLQEFQYCYSPSETGEPKYLFRIRIATYRHPFCSPYSYAISEGVVEGYKKDPKFANWESDRWPPLFRFTPSQPAQEIAVLPHESGPDIFLVPMAEFLAGAIVGGIAGNLAYDVLKDLSGKIQQSIRRSGFAKVGPFWVFPRGYEKTTNNVKIHLDTPDGTIEATFDASEGIPPEFIGYITRKLQSYQPGGIKLKLKGPQDPGRKYP